MPDINSQLERKETLLNEMAGTVGAVFLGLQVGCAQCHNHMFDPISQADFYRLRAFFEPAVAVVRDKPVTTLHTAREEIQPSHLLIRGDWRRRGPTLQAGFPRVVNLADTVVQGTTNSARRAELARWLTRPDHPLTTRVIVNRLWQFHFGHGLSRSPSDFGVMGDAPTHPELLDWLATEFVRAGWRWKAFHRLVVTSSVYRQASRVDVGDPAREAFERSLGDDPGNRWLARFPRRRLEAEAARDAMLAVAGALVDTAGGPGVRPPLPPELLDTLLKNQWETSPDASDHYRRSVYVFARRNLRFPLFAALDRPAANSSCARRQVSTTAPQALVMFNSEFSLTIARHLAGRVWQRAQDAPEQQVDWVCRLGWSRPPTRGERAVMLKFLKSQTHALVAEGRPADQLALPHATGDLAAEDRYAAAALTDLCLAILNTNEFLYID